MLLPAAGSLAKCSGTRLGSVGACGPLPDSWCRFPALVEVQEGSSRHSLDCRPQGVSDGNPARLGARSPAGQAVQELAPAGVFRLLDTLRCSSD